MDAVGDVIFDGDGSATVFDVFGIDYVFLNCEGCVVCVADVVDEDYITVNLTVYMYFRVRIFCDACD